MAFHICFSANDNYVKYAAIVMSSIVEHLEPTFNADKMIMRKHKRVDIDPNQPIVFHILTDGIKDDTKATLMGIVENLNKQYPVSVEIHTIADDAFTGFKRWHGNYLAYYRLLIPEILRGEDRALYLDTDMVALGDVRILWTVDLGDKSMGVVESWWGDPKSNTRIPFNKEKEIVCFDEFYFNSGFELFNNAKFNEKECFKKCYNYLKEYPTLSADQDALNYAVPLAESLPLSIAFNFQRCSVLDRVKTGKKKAQYKTISEDDIAIAVKEVVIVHFVEFYNKPWDYIRDTRAHNEWIRIAKKTPWWSEIEERLRTKELKRKEKGKVEVGALDGWM